MTLLAGTRLGPYEVEGLLGAGGMGEVYRARDPRLGREVAVKVLPEDVASDSGRLSLFEREARAVAALNHPNILTVHDVGTHDGTPYVVTELLEGETLRELVSRRSPTVPQILTYALQAARGLEAAHAKGIVHRDLKPENLFLTTDGRVKVLDFGLAKLVRPPQDVGSEVSTAARSSAPGQVAGTVLYMSPEQARGQSVDPRSDVFSFGVVLHQLLAGKHPFRKDTVAATLTAIVEEVPPDLESLSRAVPPAVGGIVRRCLEKGREERYESGHDIAVALEAVVAAPSGAAALREVEERSPYPGLSSFTEKDAAVFYGREREVAELWGRIRNRKLLAVIGPSGAGKTSFVHAGVLARRPGGWKAIVATPGAQPFRGLGRALGPELAADTEALGRLVDVEEPDVAVELLGRWRRGAGEALVVVDQFEELFTLNPPEVQERFAGFLRRLAAEADVHVLLSLRDDFLIRCCEQEALASVVEGLIVLLQLKPEDLQRAIEEPAKARGYRFEDEALVTEMVESVEGARAALPLLAFAVSRLWEKRDRENKLLTRAAYEEVGGVAGALAQHAEATMDRIGVDRHGSVREIFRNLVTAQGTRAVIDSEELLSAFPDRGAAEAVLHQLVDARLLTAYETEGGEGEPGHHRIEVAHESLLKAWPRLVRWQTQDEDGAQRRDQLKQAARLWEDKERTPDLLWTGSAFQEFELWRQRYPGKLTALEEDFSRAMVERAKRVRRVRRAAVAVVIAGLAVTAIAIGLSREQALEQARRAEASKLLALGGQEAGRDPSAALAYAMASLELADSPETRRFALEALWRGPTAFSVNLDGLKNAGSVDFSPDGKWLAVGGAGTGKMALLSREGGPHRLLDTWHSYGFGPDGDLLVLADDRAGSRLRLWSAGQSRRMGRLEVAEHVLSGLRGSTLLTLSRTSAESRELVVRSYEIPGGQPTDFGRVQTAGWSSYDIDPTGSRLAYAEGREVFVRSLQSLENGRGRLVGLQGDPVRRVSFHPDGQRLASLDESGEVRVWSLETASPQLLSALRGRPSSSNFPALRFGPRIAVADGKIAQLLDLTAPPDAEPAVFRRGDDYHPSYAAFDPMGRWLAVATYTENLTLWPLAWPGALVLRPDAGLVHHVAFALDGERLVSVTNDGAVKLWPLVSTPGDSARVVLRRPSMVGDLALDPGGRKLVVSWAGGNVQVLPIEGGEPRSLSGFSRSAHRPVVAFGPEGRRVAVAPREDMEPLVMRVWDLESGGVQEFDLRGPEDREDPFLGGVWALHFTSDGRLVSSGQSGVHVWNLEDGSRKRLQEGSISSEMALSRNDRSLLVMQADTWEIKTLRSRLMLIEVESGDSRAILSHGDRLTALAFGPTAQTIVTGDVEGIVRVGFSSGEEPHLLLGHRGPIGDVVVSPDGRWIASGGADETIRLWPMPDLDKPPLHTLPHDELLAKLKSLTNLRVVRDSGSSTGWSIDLDPFPGWKEVPEW